MIRINMEIIKEVMWVVVGFVYTVETIGRVVSGSILSTKICLSQDLKVNSVNTRFIRNFCGRYLVDIVLCGRYFK